MVARRYLVAYVYKTASPETSGVIHMQAEYDDPIAAESSLVFHADDPDRLYFLIPISRDVPD